MDQLVKLNSQTAGRDKLARTLQYASKFLWNELQGKPSNKLLIEKLQIIESTCGSFRKLLRFGRCIDVMYSALKNINYPDTVLMITLTLGKIANSLFLFADHVIWLSRTGLLKNVDTNKWLSTSYKYWLLNLVMNLVRDLYEIKNILSDEKIFASFKAGFSRRPLNFQLYFLTISRMFSAIQTRQDIFLDTIKNLCDIWIPLAGLQKVKLRPSVVGLLGTISSIVAIITLIKPMAKLSPA